RAQSAAGASRRRLADAVIGKSRVGRPRCGGVSARTGADNLAFARSRGEHRGGRIRKGANAGAGLEEGVKGAAQVEQAHAGGEADAQGVGGQAPGEVLAVDL